MLNKMDDVDVEYNYETSDDNNIFKTAIPMIVNIENYATAIETSGI